MSVQSGGAGEAAETAKSAGDPGAAETGESTG